MTTGGLPGDWNGIPLDRVFAVVATLPNGREQVGSGYAIDRQLVLTAAHCAHDKLTGQRARSLRVVRASDGRAFEATMRAASTTADVAVLALATPLPESIGPTRFGRVDRTHSGELTDCQAIGYPLWQLDPTDHLRGTAELRGAIRRTEGAEAQFLLLRDPLLTTVTPPANSQQTGSPASAWGGLSGALVFRGGTAIGVVVQHHPRQGASAVRLVPFDRIATAVDEDTRAVAAALGLPPVELMPVVDEPGREVSLVRLVECLKHGDLPTAVDLDPYRLGATVSNYGNSLTYGERDTYVPRGIEAEFRTALQSEHFVLLVGPSKAGKTRTAYEALRSQMPQSRLVVPSTGALGALAAHARLRESADPVVIWLDDLNRYLIGDEPLTIGILEQLLSRRGPTLVLGTLRREERDRLRGDNAELSRDVRTLLDTATTFELASTAEDPHEQSLAGLSYPDEDLTAFGLAERLAHAPDLLMAYHDAASTDPLRHILIRTAIDWTRAGLGRPIPEPDLIDIAREALWSERPELDPHDEEVNQALDRARSPLAGSARVAPLLTYALPGRVRGYQPFDYLVAADDGQTGEPRPMLGTVWSQILDRATPSDAHDMGLAAYFRRDTPHAITALQVAAEAGDVGAMTSLAGLLAGRRPPDAARARRWYQRAADAGHTEAMLALGSLLSELDPPDRDGARSAYESAANVGSVQAMCALGTLLNGTDSPDWEAARHWYQCAAEAGDTEAMVKLGKLLQERRPPDLEGARRWYQCAAEAGNQEAMVELGLMLAKQEPPDVSSAGEWLERATMPDGGESDAMFELRVLLQRLDPLAEIRALTVEANAGDTNAMVELARRLAYSNPPDLEGARKWFHAADSAGVSDALRELGWVQAYTDPPDLRGARDSFQRAAERGDVGAMLSLAAVLLRLEPPDPGAAEHWYQAAAMAGSATAMLGLGHLYRRAEPPDLDTARGWYQRAAEKGSVDALHALGLLEASVDPPNLDSAVAWYRAAAQAGHRRAMVHLGVLLAGIEPPDRAAASEWLTAAEEAGASDDAFNLRAVLTGTDRGNWHGPSAWVQVLADAGQGHVEVNPGWLLQALEPTGIDSGTLPQASLPPQRLPAWLQITPDESGSQSGIDKPFEAS